MKITHVPSSSLTRRGFLKNTALGLAAASAMPQVSLRAAASENLVESLYKSLNEEQRGLILKPFADPLRSEVKANWSITDARVGRDFSEDQQEMIREIFLGLHSEGYAISVLGQVAHDTGGKGLEKCSVALFGEPGAGKFEFVITSRHMTRRCDGNSVEGSAFGGPLFYGHQAGPNDEEAPDHPGNIYWYQAQRANQVFAMLDGKQRELALRPQGRRERNAQTVALKGAVDGIEGLPVSELTADQKGEFRKVVADILAPFRENDRRESWELVEKGGIDNLRLAFFQRGDLGNDGIWDVWHIEGPSMVCYFRGEPHVHAYIHIKDPEQVQA